MIGRPALYRAQVDPLRRRRRRRELRIFLCLGSDVSPIPTAETFGCTKVTRLYEKKIFVEETSEDIGTLPSLRRSIRPFSKKPT